MAVALIDISQVTSKSLKNKTYIVSFPEFYRLATITENSLWHNNQTVLDHAIGVFTGLETILEFKDLNDKQLIGIKTYLSQSIGNKTRRDILKIAALLHDIAKPDVFVKKSDGTVVCPGHELIGAGRVKEFVERFGLDIKAASYVERIVRYHGFISEILNLVMANQSKEKYLQIFKETVGDVAIELTLMMHADLLGCDLEKGDKKGFDDRIYFLRWMLEEFLKKVS